jgi:uncharacterized membrane protein YhaH (DUF805 family)
MRGFLSKWFKGRIGRRRYWSLTLLCLLAFVVGIASFIALGIMLDAGPTDAITAVLAPIGFVFILSMSAALAGIGVRRLHDRGKTGYWLLLYYAMPSWMMKSAGLDAVGLVFLAATSGILIWAIVDLGVLRGDTGSNDFGPGPLAENPASRPAD